MAQDLILKSKSKKQRWEEEEYIDPEELVDKLYGESDERGDNDEGFDKDYYMETVPRENTTMSVIRESEKRKNEKKQLREQKVGWKNLLTAKRQNRTMKKRVVCCRV
jgi:hypothetical protein